LFVAAVGARSVQAAGKRVAFDRVAVRYTSPETGGTAKPKFLFDRQVAFLVRVEALLEDGQLGDDYIDRHLRSTVEREVAEQMLAALQVRSEEPKRLPDLVESARDDLEEQIGKERFQGAMDAEGITAAELDAVLRDRVRAMTYVDGEVMPFLQPSEDELYSAFRSAVHPYRSSKYEVVRARFLRWYVLTRFRTISLDYLQGVKSRTTIVYL
jgi:hypothetical protein